MPLHPLRALRPRMSRWLDGPHGRLPAPADAFAEHWARLRPRVRTLVVVALLVATALALNARVRSADRRWGGPPVNVLVATRDLPVGTARLDRAGGGSGALRAVQLPPVAVPPGAVLQLPDNAVLALALPGGTVLTRTHLSRRGPAVGLPPDQRAVPFPVSEGVGVAAGGWVDVWVLGAGEAPAALVASSRPVLEVRPGASEVTALVGLDAAEVGPATTGLALGRVLLAHAPPPDPLR